MKTLLTLVVLVVSGSAFAQAGQARKQPDAGYKWNALGHQQIEALSRKIDLKGADALYEICAGCHLPSGAGRPDGLFPQLAGQHATVTLKQLADIRAGARDNPVMHPFSVTLTDAQLANLAGYIATLPVPHDNGKGPGTDLSTGVTLYERDCKSCHGQRGEGDGAKFYPVLAGQHYRYMLRQATDIRDGRRRNANPEMVKVIKGYTDQQVDAVVDYMSRLTMPEQKKSPPAGRDAGR